ncbi:MAG: hypothetical protein ACI83P_000306 [Janthinobacterium sp.]
MREGQLASFDLPVVLERHQRLAFALAQAAR